MSKKRRPAVHMGRLQRIVATPITDPVELAAIDERRRKYMATLFPYGLAVRLTPGVWSKIPVPSAVPKKTPEQLAAIRRALAEVLKRAAGDPGHWLEQHVAAGQEQGYEEAAVLHSLQRILEPREKRKRSSRRAG